MRVRDVMSTPTVVVTSAATVDEAIAVMTGRGLTTLPVVDHDNRMLGLITEDDLVRAKYLPRPRSGEPDTGVMLGGHEIVGSLMRCPGSGVAPETELTDLAARMIELRLRSIPVLDGGRVIGMVTWRDLLRALPGSGRTNGDSRKQAPY